MLHLSEGTFLPNQPYPSLQKATTDTVPDIVLKLMRTIVDETSTKTFIYHTLSKGPYNLGSMLLLKPHF